MKLGSHNTFTYLPAKRWWMKIFAITARCQRVDLMEQYELGVRLFDLRVRFDKNGAMVICHGLIEYQCQFSRLLLILDEINKKGDCYMRIVLETAKPDKEQERRFRNLCSTLSTIFDSIHFFGGNNRADWNCKNPIYQFDTPMQDLDDRYSSTTTLFPKGWKWLHYIDDLCPILYAKLHNRRNKEAGTTHDWLFIDFVDIG